MYFEEPSEAKFDFALSGTGLEGMTSRAFYIHISGCILSALLAREEKRVLHTDPRSFYGNRDASVSLSQLQDLEDKPWGTVKLLNFCRNTRDSLQESDRNFAIDLSVPKLVPCRSKSVDLLINQGVSPYLSFASIKRTAVYRSDGQFIEIPSSRASIFQDKRLKLNEKRALMKLFQTAATTDNAAIKSAAYTSKDEKIKAIVPGGKATTVGSAVDYLKSSFGIEREDLIAGIIHGACLYMRPAESMDIATLRERLSIFIESLTQYEQGCPFLVPMYGNCDLPQAFARNAAVHGALFVLNCDECQLWSELSNLGVELPTKIEFGGSPCPNCCALHAIACIKQDRTDFHEPTLYVSPATTLNEEPVFIIELPNSGPSSASVSVCPQGFVLVHFVQLYSDNPPIEKLKDVISRFLKGKEVVFQTILLNEDVGSDPFGLEREFENARRTFNATMGYAADTPLPSFDERSADSVIILEGNHP